MEDQYVFQNREDFDRFQADKHKVLTEKKQEFLEIFCEESGIIDESEKLHYFQIFQKIILKTWKSYLFYF